MQLFIFTIRDSAAEFYNSPFVSRSHGEAERNFKELVQDSNSTLHKHPEHFDLYYLGRFDDATGKYDLLPAPEHRSKAIDLMPSRPALLS